MPVLDNGTRDQYTATAAQTVFPYTFEIFAKEDVAVEVDGVLKAEGTDYTVSGVGNDSGGNIIFLVGRTAGEVITIYRDMELKREQDYQQSGDFLADEVDADFDRLWLAVQQVTSNYDLSIRAPKDDSVLTSSNTVLPAASTRAGKVVSFDSTGTLAYISSTLPNGDFTEVNTAAAMAALASPSVGDVALVKDRASAIFDAVLTSGVTPNTYDVIQSTADPLISWQIRGEKLTFRMFGANADGTTDDSASIDAAITYAKANSLWIDGEGLSYYMETQVTHDDNIMIKNATFVLDSALSKGFQFGSSDLAATTTIASDVLLADEDVEVSSATGITAGMLMVLTSNRVWPYDAPRNLNAGEIHLVTDVTGTTITIDGVTYDNYDVSGETVTAQFYNPSTNIKLHNVKITRPTAVNQQGITIQRCLAPELSNVTISNCAAAGATINFCIGAKIDGIGLYDNWVAGSGTGYGLQDNSSVGTVITNLTAWGNRRSIDFSGGIPSRNGVVDGFYVRGLQADGSCIGTHGTAQGITFQNGICDSGLCGAQIRSPGSVISNVKFLNTQSRGIILSYTLDLTINGCEQDQGITQETGLSTANTVTRFLEINNLPATLNRTERLVVTNNRIDCRTEGIRIVPAATDGIKHIFVKDNIFTIDTNSSGNDLHMIFATAACNMDESVIWNNTLIFSTNAGVHTTFNSNISISDSAEMIIDRYDLVDADIVKWNASGAIANVVMDAYYYNDGRNSGIKGQVEFEVTTSGAKVRIENIPQKETGTGILGRSVYEGTTEYLISKYENQYLYIAAPGWAATDEAFGLGTYKVMLDMEWKNRFPFSW